MYYLQLGIAGLVAGSAYALSSVGMITIYKGTRVINFALGAVGMVAAYVYGNWISAGKNDAVGVLLGVGASVLVGLVMYLVAMVPLRGASQLARMVSTFGVLLLLQGLATLRWGSNSEAVAPLFKGNIRLGSLIIQRQSLAALVVTLIATAALALVFARTKVGRAIEAASVSPESASMLGYNVTLLGALTWGIASLAAGLAGILIVPSLGLNESSLTLVVISAMVGALVGSFRYIWPAVIASYVIGIAGAYLDTLVSSVPGLDQAVPLAAVIIVLLVAGNQVTATQYRDETSQQPRVSRARVSIPKLLIAVGGVVLVLALLNSFWQSLAAQGAALALITLSLVLVTGYVGQISLMQWILAGVGAFNAGALAVNQKWPMLACVLVGAFAAAGVALVIGVISVRFHGITLAIVSLSASVTVASVLFTRYAAGAGYTMPAPSLFGLHLANRGLAYTIAVLVAVVCVGLYLLRQSRLGKRLLAIRSSERASLSSGIRIVGPKLAVFTVGGFIAGLGGGFYAYATGVVAAASFDPVTSVTLLAFAYLNGVGTIAGGVAAGLGVGLGGEFLTNIVHVNGVGWFDVLGGLALIVTLIQKPDGALAGAPQGRTSSRDRAQQVWRLAWAPVRANLTKRASYQAKGE